LPPASSAAAPAVDASRVRALGIAAVLLLLALRLPSLVQPPGGDQGLFAYEAQRLAAGDVLYRDMWDQKPPMIAFVYRGLLAIHDGGSIVPAADLACAAIVSALFVVIGRRRFTEGIGLGAAVAFLLLGDPYIQRLSGVYVRAQCEPFINVAITAALAILAARRPARVSLIAAGVAFGCAVWLKYNAVAYALPLALAVWLWALEEDERAPTALAARAGWIALGASIVTVPILSYFAIHGELGDLYLATIQYNLGYSAETYRGPLSVVRYLVAFPFERARADPLWFTGGVGVLLLVIRRRESRSVLVLGGWLLAAAVSIAINGSRDLPNYFVQAFPALALATSAGLASLAGASAWLRVATAGALLLGLWRVGPDEPVLGLRWAGAPGMLENMRFDLAYARGAVDRDTYLGRFGAKKFNAYEIDALARFIEQSTTPDERVLVFGFSGGSVGWASHRASPSRFFWSMPVKREFAAGSPGYGSAAFLEELRRRPPAIVALQHEEWQSADYFLNHPQLRAWLEAGYRLDHQTPMFSVWRRVG
jgi:hypothetical protein